MFGFIAKKILSDLANEFEKNLIAMCNRINGQLVDRGFDNEVVELQRKLANTVFIDSHKNEKFRTEQLHKICKKVGIRKGFEIYFRRPLNFIRIGELLLI